MNITEGLIDLTERLSYAIERETGHLRFGIENPRPADYAQWACVAVCGGYFITADWAVDWIRHGYPEPPQWLTSVCCKSLGGNNAE